MLSLILVTLSCAALTYAACLARQQSHLALAKVGRVRHVY